MDNFLEWDVPIIEWPASEQIQEWIYFNDFLDAIVAMDHVVTVLANLNYTIFIRDKERQTSTHYRTHRVTVLQFSQASPGEEDCESN